jgi:tRNA threonylcarbamoyladenosine biosynthesis protein TsaE
VLTRSASETRALGALVAGLVVAGDVLLLSGGLGAGKTTFTQGLLAGLGSGERVTSPTFTLMRTYGTTPPVAHVDCWRLGALDEVADLALDEVLDDGGVAVVEWGEAAAPLIGRDALEVLIEVAEPDRPDAAGPPVEPGDRRLVRLVPTSGSWQDRLERLAESVRRSGLTPTAPPELR